MKIKHVTLTGADNSVTPGQLVEIAEAHPLAEFGILFSEKHEDTPRFPGYHWTRDLAAVAKQTPSLKLSAHLCGRWVRDTVIKGLPGWFEDRIEFVPMFQRIQFNFHAEPTRFGDKFFELLQNYPEKEFIFQFDGVNDGILDRFKEYGLKNAVALFDQSGGNGISPGSWPKPIGALSGYAGGLGPDNLKIELSRIGKAAGDAEVWVDLESKIRDDGNRVFSVRKVIAALQEVDLYINPPAKEEDGGPLPPPVEPPPIIETPPAPDPVEPDKKKPKKAKADD